MRLHRTQILIEPAQHSELDRIARRERRSLSDVVREMIEAQLVERRRREMARAAEALRGDYAGDSELTAFSALDREDFR